MTIKEFAMTSLAFFLLLSCFYLQFATATDTITPSKSIKFPESIISNGSKFQLGIFNLTDSTDLFVGIWYYGMDPANGVVWVANRQKPLKDSSGIVMISEDGNLVVLNGQKEVLWSSSVQNLEAKNTSAQLQDSGNLVLVDKTTGMNVWESFRQPNNVGMPTMEVGLNMRTGEKVQLTSRKSPSDPSIGNFSAGINPSSIPQFFVWNNSKPCWRSGPWNGRIFIGVPDMHSFPLDGFNLVADKEEGSLYLTFAFADESNLLDFLLDSEGKLVARIWHRREKRWEIKRSIPETECDVYGKCGPFGSCDYSKKPNICSCLKGFKPTNAREWNRGNWTSGCVRKTALQCHRTNNISEVGNKVGFLKLENMRVPDFVERSTIQEDECKDSCQKSCSCIAYAYDANIGCMTWNGTLIDIRKSSSGGIDLYIRVPYSELDRKLGMIMTISGIVGITIISICAMLVWKLIAKHRACKKRIKDMKLFDRRKTSSKFSSEMLRDSIKELQELPLFSYEEVANATRNFDPANQLGKGGFGPVYRGTLQNGQEIAVKRLSRASGQGLEEFMNEVLVISNVQHRNLVRLLGCCVEHEEKILIYEYLPNKSLDSFLFDPLKKEFLDWGTRFSIIEGISQGLLYLYRDSRLRIIHRDLKAGNILLDERLNPKISDFGMARIFGGDEEHANTRRIAGTYGYMSPEYAMEGLFSEKSDVFSYGVLLLEIVSGRGNTGFYNDKHSLSLVGYAWKLWNEGNISALIDEAISDPCHHREALRCIHVGLMCVQEFAEDRPTMSKVISMLNSEIGDLPPPKQPAFCQNQILLNSQSSSQDEYKYYSVNDVSASSVQGR